MQTKSWLIVPLIITSAAEIVNGINYKVPEHVGECSGIFFSADTYIPKTADDHIPILGTISLWFNSKKTHTVHYFIEGLNPKELKRKYSTLKLRETLKGGTLIQGYMEDNGLATSYPYKLNIYLECSLKCECHDK
jgi:hypothetical protein